MPAVDIFPIELTEREAHRLADLYGVLADLRMVLKICDLILQKIGPKDNLVEVEALQAAALVRYCRTTGGVRTSFSISMDWIERLPSELQQLHNEFHALRDKHIAHSVNDWELNVPVAQYRLNRETNKGEVIMVSVQGHRIVSMHEEAIVHLQRLAGALADMLEGEFQVERDKVLEIAKRIPQDEIERRMGTPPRVPGRGALTEPRPR